MCQFCCFIIQVEYTKNVPIKTPQFFSFKWKWQYRKLKIFSPSQSACGSSHWCFETCFLKFEDMTSCLRSEQVPVSQANRVTSLGDFSLTAHSHSQSYRMLYKIAYVHLHEAYVHIKCTHVKYSSRLLQLCDCPIDKDLCVCLSASLRLL